MEDVYNNWVPHDGYETCMTSRTDMLPFNIHELLVVGVFRAVSNEARNKGIFVGSNFSVVFPTPTTYVLKTSDYTEQGTFEWKRATHNLAASGGGMNRIATMTCVSSTCEWESTWISFDRFEGEMQSKWGVADFALYTPVTV